MDWYRSVRLFRAASIGVSVSLAGFASAQNAEPDIKTQLSDFVFYVNVHQTEAAAGMASEIFGAGMTPREFLEAVEEHGLEDDLDEAIGKALRSDELEPFGARMLKMLTDGRLQRARDPNEIERNIEGLVGGLRERLYARERLKAAGEYAMPQLIDALLQRADIQLRTQVQRLLNESGRSSVIPLSVSLMDIEPAAQEQVVNVLGQLGYEAAAPYISELRDKTLSDPVRAACDRALDSLGVSGSTAELYLQLAEGYYNEREELTSFPGEQMQLLWDYDPSIGLNPTAIETEVYHEARAMRLAERSMEFGSQGPGALGLWVAANFSREIDETPGYDNPAYPPSMREAMYYAVASGPIIGEVVLSRALEDNDTRLARRAVEAIHRTAGPGLIWDRSSGQSPLVSALTYPSRRVQYDAALAIAASQPRSNFAGSERVVPALASAIRFAGTSYALVITEEEEQYRSIRRVIESQGYQVLPFGSDVAEIAEAIAEAPGIDLVVTQAAAGRTEPLIDAVRSRAKLSAAPIFSMVASNELPRLRRLHSGDVSIMVRPFGIGEDLLSSALTELVDSASGGVIEVDEARQFAMLSLDALRDLSVANNAVLDVSDSTASLVSAMNETTGEVRLQVAEVLSRIGRSSAQATIAEAALAASGTERVDLLGKLAGSAKRYGNQLDAPMIEQLVELSATGEDDEATAAATVIGALGLPQSDLVRLILAGQ
ncbi:MAG: HEAT repeat domain-containing protein [Phycisphaera sp.]|nr:MAG: HEAT repeat domain-containing protein [Phycisphaera sp.]